MDWIDLDKKREYLWGILAKEAEGEIVRALRRILESTRTLARPGSEDPDTDRYLFLIAHGRLEAVEDVILYLYGPEGR